jgi:uncharacterized protein YbjT (DUF2867 family)
MSTKARILVTSAAGHTGAAVVARLLDQGFAVRAFVRRQDSRSERLRAAGAEIFVGDLYDMRDLRAALRDVQRAYYCPPFAPNLLHGAMLFALAAEEARLEVVALVSGWNPHSTHPSITTREHWIANNVYRWMPTVDVIHVNPGLFAFTAFLGLPAVANFGMLLLPYGEGQDAPPAQEDIAAVAAAVLADPRPHIGRSYRPTGPRLLTGHDYAGVFSRIFDREVRYRDVSTSMFIKAATAQGLKPFEIAQLRHYVEEVRGGTFAVGAPTDHVELVTGRPPEDFETTARRYVANPALIMPGFQVGGPLGALWLTAKTIVTRVPNLDRWESERGHPLLSEPVLAHDSDEWRATAQRKQLALLEPGGPMSAGRRRDSTSAPSADDRAGDGDTGLERHRLPTVRDRQAGTLAQGVDA